MQIYDIQVTKDQKETTKHGSVDFPIAVYHSVMRRNVLGYINWHWHEEFQFCIVTRGEIVFYINEKQYLLNEGDGLFINSGCLHMAKPVTDPESTYLCIDIHPRLLSAFPGSIIETKYVSPYLRNRKLNALVFTTDIEWQNSIMEQLKAIDGLYQDKKFAFELEICRLIIGIWMELITHIAEYQERSTSSLNTRNMAVQEILGYISKHYGESISLGEIAKELSFSTSECCRMFKKVTGETIFTYLMTYRILKATEMLQNTDLSISEIAYETGFGSTSYFIEKFKEKTGKTPLQFRKNKEKAGASE